MKRGRLLDAVGATSKRPRSHAAAALALLALLLLALASAAAPSLALAARSAAVRSPDTHTAEAYLRRTHAFDRTALANLAAGTAAAAAWRAMLERECAGVAAGAPDIAALGRGAPLTASEQLREIRETAAMTSEIIDGSVVAELAPDRRAALSAARALARLHWSDRRLRRLARLEVAELRAEFATPAPNVCADLRAWAASGFRTLPHATIQRFGGGGEGHELLAVALERDGIAAVKTLARRTRRLEETLTRHIGAGIAPLGHLITVLGFPESQPASNAPEEPPGTVIGRGTSAIGGSFVVGVSKPQPREACGVTLSINEANGSGSSASSECLPNTAVAPHASVTCEQGTLRIVALLPGAVNSASVTLSDGSAIVSPVFAVPAADGGPLGVYYQALRGPSPIPVSLVERGAHEEVLGVVPLARVVECTSHPRKLLPGGRRVLARGSTPGGGPAFTISGEHFKLLGHVGFELAVHVAGSGGAGGGGAGGGAIQPPERPGAGLGPGAGADASFSWTVSGDCARHPYAIVYGLLRRGRIAFARTAHGERALRVAAIPRGLGAHGELVYIALTRLPQALIVRDRSGHTLHTDSLASPHHSTRCTRAGGNGGEEESSSSGAISVGNAR